MLWTCRFFVPFPRMHRLTPATSHRAEHNERAREWARQRKHERAEQRAQQQQLQQQLLQQPPPVEVAMCQLHSMPLASVAVHHPKVSAGC